MIGRLRSLRRSKGIGPRASAEKKVLDRRNPLPQWQEEREKDRCYFSLWSLNSGARSGPHQLRGKEMGRLRIREVCGQLQATRKWAGHQLYLYWVGCWVWEQRVEGIIVCQLLCSLWSRKLDYLLMLEEEEVGPEAEKSRASLKSKQWRKMIRNQSHGGL